MTLGTTAASLGNDMAEMARGKLYLYGEIETIATSFPIVRIREIACQTPSAWLCPVTCWGTPFDPDLYQLSDAKTVGLTYLSTSCPTPLDQNQWSSNI